MGQTTTAARFLFCPTRLIESKPVTKRWQSEVVCANDIQQIGGSIEYGNTGDPVEDAKLIIDSAQRSAHQVVNVALVVRNWLLGRRIAEEELGDATRHELYGREVVEQLAAKLTGQYGRGYTKRSLYQYVQFYRLFPEIVQTASARSLPLLSWSHYSELLRVEDPEARSWYEKEALEQGWAVKTLRRNINTQCRQQRCEALSRGACNRRDEGEDSPSSHFLLRWVG